MRTSLMFSGLLMFAATAFAQQPTHKPPACRLSIAGNQLTASLPASTVPPSAVSWQLDGLPLDDTTATVTFTVDSFSRGTFDISATSDGHILCRESFKPHAAEVTYRPFVDPYPRRVRVMRKASIRRAAHRAADNVQLSAAESANTVPALPVAPTAAAPPPPPPAAGNVSASPTPVPVSGAISAPGAHVVKVYFATERKILPSSGQLTTASFTGLRDPDNQLRYGVAAVSIPPTHQRGEIETPSWYKFEFSADPAKHFTASLKMVGQDDFFGQIATQLHQYSKAGDVFVYVHGFNNGFEDELFRTAQLAYDTGFDGAPLLFDWPSFANVFSYPADNRAILASIPRLKQFLLDVSSRSGAHQLNIIAHSLGAFGVVTALSELLAEGHLPQINQLILAAPDVDQNNFSVRAPQLAASGKIRQVTLYASQRDLAMKASLKENKVMPVGGLPPITTASGITTIDVSAVETNFLGHDYFVSSPPVLLDIRTLFRTGDAPPRDTLLPVEAAPVSYWRLLKPN